MSGASITEGTNKATTSNDSASSLPTPVPVASKKQEELELMREKIRQKQEALAQKRDDFRRKLDKLANQVNCASASFSLYWYLLISVRVLPVRGPPSTCWVLLPKIPSSIFVAFYGGRLHESFSFQQCYLDTRIQDLKVILIGLSATLFVRLFASELLDLISGSYRN
jgi:hypothetical protein